MAIKPDAALFVAAAAELMRLPEGADAPEVAAEYLARVRAAPSSSPSAPPLKRVFEEDVRDGLRVRVYVPDGEPPFPVVVYFHGGGWVTGDLEMHDATCRRLAHRAQCAVVNVDYRLAPEHQFPAAFEDAYRATVWARVHASEFSADGNRLAVAGSSAGGNLAAAVALRARDEGGPPIALQALIYPVTDASMDSDSMRDLGVGYLLERRLMQWYWSQYLQDEAQRRNPWASPMAADSLAGLPPALVITAELDPLRDEGEAFAQRLEDDGGEAEVTRYPGQVHGFMGVLGSIADADLALDALADWIAARLTPTGA
jgi:acetyl esterase